MKHIAEMEEELTSQAGSWISSLLGIEDRTTVERDRKTILRLLGIGIRGNTHYRQRHLHDLRDELCEVVFQLISNLRHAFYAENRQRSIPSHRDHSYVQLYTTRGGKNSYDRLHIVVADFGHGIVHTLLPDLNNKVNDFRPKDVILALLSQALPDYGRGSGRGYKTIVDIVRRFGGKLYLTTASQSHSEQRDTLLAELHNTHPPHVRLDDTLAYCGTTAHVVIPI